MIWLKMIETQHAASPLHPTPLFSVGARHAVPLHPQTEAFGKPVAGSLPTIIRSYKSAAARQINHMRQTPGQPVWHRNYYEHIIRSEAALNRIREYILYNPARWSEDEYYSQRG